MSQNLSKNQELELLSALDSRAESPLKFAYVGEGYSKWIEVGEKSRKEHSVQFEENLLKIESLPFIFRDINELTKIVNIIDFGCGDGVPILSVIEYLRNRGVSVRYIPVDISQHMLSAATETVKKNFSDVEVVEMLSDFEKGEILENILQLTKVKDTRNYFFLLGNTLGNFENTENVLANLKLSMFSEDSLVIGNQISNLLAAQKFVEYYRTEEVLDLVSSTLRGYGMNCSFDDYAVRWNGNSKQIEMALKLPENKAITVAGYTVEFERGEEILLAISKKFAEETIVEVFNNVGFRVDLFTTNKKKNTCIIAVTPTRYKS
jgi:uncharacterized SAM-dependent methyltransferase